VGRNLKTISDQLGHASMVLTADIYTSVLLAVHYKTAEATAPLVLDATPPSPQQDRDCDAANPGRGRQSRSYRLPVATDQGSSQATAVAVHPSDHRPWQPRGNHMTTTVHGGLNEQLYPQLKVARPKGLEPLTF
jgi:hypothetical protein